MFFGFPCAVLPFPRLSIRFPLDFLCVSGLSIHFISFSVVVRWHFVPFSHPLRMIFKQEIRRGQRYPLSKIQFKIQRLTQISNLYCIPSRTRAIPKHSKTYARVEFKFKLKLRPMNHSWSHQLFMLHDIFKTPYSSKKHLGLHEWYFLLSKRQVKCQIASVNLNLSFYTTFQTIAPKGQKPQAKSQKNKELHIKSRKPKEDKSQGFSQENNRQCC